VKIGHTTSFKYAIVYSYLIFRFLVWYLQKRPLRNVGPIWQVDEKQISVCGHVFWLVCVVDLTTEFVLVLKVIPNRTVANLTNALLEARRIAGKVPGLVETDALKGYRKAVTKCFGDIPHWRAKKSEWYGINNLAENLNSKLEGWIRIHKGFHSLITAQLIANGLWIHHNFVKRTTSQYLVHRTTAQAAGFDIELTKPWSQLITLAEKAALLARIPRPLEAGILAIQTELDRWFPSPKQEQPIVALATT